MSNLEGRVKDLERHQRGSREAQFFVVIEDDDGFYRDVHTCEIVNADEICERGDYLICVKYPLGDTTELAKYKRSLAR